MKTIPITPKGDVMSCVNLRPQYPSGRCLVPVGNPTALDRGEKPLYRGETASGSKFFLSIVDGRELRLKVGDTLYHPGDVEGEPVSVIEHYSRLMLVYPHKVMAVSLSPGSEGKLETLPAPLSPLSLTAVDAPTIYYSTPAIEFSGVYTSRASIISRADCRLVTSALAEAYRQLDIIAAGQATYLQPMLGRYRLIDSNGGELYLSAPVILGPQCGINFMEAVAGGMTLSGTQGSYSGVAPMRVGATPYKVVLRLDCDPADEVATALLRAASRVEVLLSPQLHPLDDDAVSGCMMRHDSTSATLLAYMPGVAVGTTVQPNMLAPQVVSMLARLDKALDIEATMGIKNDTFNDGPIVLPRGSSRLVDEEQARVAAIGRMTTDIAGSSSTELLTLASAPHSFAGRHVAVSGGTVLWGDVTTRLFSGYSACEMAREVADGTGSSKVQVVMPGGGYVNRSVPKSPTLLSPLVCYPHPSALTMRMQVKQPDGTFRYISYQLTTVAGCRYAFRLNPSLMPIDLSEEGSVHESAILFPDESNTTRHFSGGIICADVLSPLRPRSAANVSSSSIKGLAPVLRDVGGWNFSRTRFYMLSSSGVMSVSVGSDYSLGAPTLLRHGCSSGKWTMAYDRLLAVVDNALVAFSGAKPRVVIPAGVTEVGYTGLQQEVWVKTGGSIRVYDTALTGYYTRDFNDAHEFVSLGDKLYFATAGGRYYDATAEVEASMPVYWRGRVEVAPGYRLSGIRAMMQGEAVRGTLTASADGGAGQPHSLPVLTLNIDGSVNYPVAARVAAPARPYLNVVLNALVSPDFTISSIALTTINHDAKRITL